MTAVTCPKCDYARQPGDTAPEYECPRCGIVYAKYVPKPSALEPAAKAMAPRPQSEKDAVQPRSFSMRDKICRRCGAVGRLEESTPGSLLIEIVAWFVLIVPGLIYSLWRHSSRRVVCASCGSSELVALESPVGLKLVGEYHPGVEVSESVRPAALKRSPVEWLFQFLKWAIVAAFSLGALSAFVEIVSRSA